MNTAILVGTDLSHEFDSMHADLVFMNQYFNELYYRFVKTGFLNKLLYDKIDQELISTVERVNKKVRDIAFGKEKIRENSALFRLLEIYKSENKKISEEDIVNQTKMLLFAGYETTSLTLTWLTYYLSERPNLQEELFNELKNLTFLNIEDLSKARLTKSVLLETLRIRPIGWGFTRYAIQDDSYSEYEIKADDCIFISPYLIHHKDKYYSDASTFNERRFMDVNTRDLGTKFLTFGAGPRTCVGEELALIQLILAVRSLIVNFTFKNTTGEIECNPQTTLMLKKTFNVSFKRRILK
jgi:cytochrome P450